MKILIVYKSILGSTKQYAYWLAEEIDADIMTFGKVKEKTFGKYDIVIVASGTYAGKMPLVGFLEKYWATLQYKKIIALAVGIAPLYEEASMQSYKLIPERIRTYIRYFKVPGKMPFVKPIEVPAKEKLQPVISYVHSLQ